MTEASAGLFSCERSQAVESIAGQYRHIDYYRLVALHRPYDDKIRVFVNLVEIHLPQFSQKYWRLVLPLSAVLERSAPWPLVNS